MNFCSEQKVVRNDGVYYRKYMRYQIAITSFMEKIIVLKNNKMWWMA